MKKYIMFSCVAMLAFQFAGAGKAEGSLNIIVPLSEQATPPRPVKVDESNIRVISPDFSFADVKNPKERRRRERLFFETPKGSLASSLEKSGGAGFLWSPLYMPGGVGIRLPDADLSADSSVLAFVETTGAPEGPFGSRIVLLNTAAWRPLARIRLDSFYIKKIRFATGGVLAALCEGQKSRRSENAFILIDAVSKKVIDAAVLDFTPEYKASFSASGSMAAIAEHGGGKIRLYGVSGGKIAEKGVLNSENTNPALLIDGSKLYASGEKSFEIFDIPGRKKISYTNLPPEYTVRSIAKSPDGGFILSPSEFSGKPFLFVGNMSVKAFGDVSNGLVRVSSENSKIYAALDRNDSIAVYHMPEMYGKTVVSGRLLKPKTNGKMLFFFYIKKIDSFAVMDSKGVFYLLYLPEKSRKWSKYVIFGLNGNG